jgi:hypothetical protein
MTQKYTHDVQINKITVENMTEEEQAERAADIVDLANRKAEAEAAKAAEEAAKQQAFNDAVSAAVAAALAAQQAPQE